MTTDNNSNHNKEILMRRLSDASQYKIYPSIIPRNELPLRKILLTTRLWNHVRRQQALSTMPTDDWLFDQQSVVNVVNTTPSIEEKEQESHIPSSNDTTSSSTTTTTTPIACDWTWFDQETENSSLLDSLNVKEEQENTHIKSDLLSHDIILQRKRSLDEEEEEQETQSNKKSKQDFLQHHHHYPASPAGPASSPSSPNSSPVLLSA